MKKMAAIVSLLLLLGLVVIMVVASQQPQTFKIQRSLYMETPAQQAFQNVVDLKAWRNWSPWFERDPEMKMTYSEPAVGKGAEVRWESATEGKGLQTITDVVGEEAIKIRLKIIEPMVSESQVYFHFTPKDNGVEVEWIMDAYNHTLMDKAFYWLLNLPEMIGKDFEKGLSNLKNHLTSS